MRFSFWAGAGQPWDEILSATQHVERTGWDGVYVADHFMPLGTNDLGPIHECWSILAGLAAAVPRLRIGSIVAGNTYRNPAVLAKQAATIDHISHGRLILGIGAGWQENEHLAYGIDYSTVKGRLDRLEESVQILRSLFDNERTTFAGHYRITDAPLSPKPVQAHLPILVGGKGEKRTMRIAAQYADEWNCWGDAPFMKAKIEVLERHCADVGRDPSSIKRSACAMVFMSDDQEWLGRFRGKENGPASIVGTPQELVDMMGAYVEAGVDELLVPDFNLGDPQRKRDTLDRFITEVAAHFR